MHDGVVLLAATFQPRWAPDPVGDPIEQDDDGGDDDDDVSAEDVMAHTRGKLAPFKTVKKVEVVTEIPRNPSGKLLEREPGERFPEPTD